MSYILYDIALLAILAFFLWRGYRKGFVLTLCSLLAVFVALIGATIFSDVLAEPVASAIEPAVTSSIHDTITSYWQRSPAETTSEEKREWLSQLPLEDVLEPLEESRFFQGYVETFQETVNDRSNAIIDHAAQSVAHFVAVRIARIVIFAAAFIAVLIAWWFLSHTLDLVAKLPVLSTVNAWAGGAVGLLKGALLVSVAVWLFRDSFLTPEAVGKTFLLDLFCIANPLSLFL